LSAVTTAHNTTNSTKIASSFFIGHVAAARCGGVA
jgi:hypothetical protein